MTATAGAVLQALPFLLLGFLFNAAYLRTRFVCASAEGQRLFFLASSTGAVFALFGWWLRPKLRDSVFWGVLESLPGQSTAQVFAAIIGAVFVYAILTVSLWLRTRFVKLKIGAGVLLFLTALLFILFLFSEHFIAEVSSVGFVSVWAGASNDVLALLILALVFSVLLASLWIAFAAAENSLPILRATLTSRLISLSDQIVRYLSGINLLSKRNSFRQFLKCWRSINLKRYLHNSYPSLLSEESAPNLNQLAYCEWVKRSGSPIQKVAIEAFERQHMVLVCLKSRKVYAGLIFRMPPASTDWQGQSLELVPAFSAARSLYTLQFTSRLDYFSFAVWQLIRWRQRLALAYGATTREKRRLLGEDLADEDIKSELDDYDQLLSANEAPESFSIVDWAKVIPISEIETISLYDQSTPSDWFSGAAVRS
ncbi:hypothetical protein [Halomonas denitrificans]|nr:hypothetical protein [Halomonas denitrificans]